MKSTSHDCFLPSCFSGNHLLLFNLEFCTYAIIPDPNPKILLEVNSKPQTQQEPEILQTTA